MSSDNEKKEKKSFRDSLNLPRTDFPIRAQAEKFDPAILDRWKNEKLYKKTFVHNKGREQFILHDGPPYANGNIHIGHAYNKVLKDIIAKSERMSGKHVPIIPGWDCHGLPIELKVSKENPDVDVVTLKKKCREYAAKWVDVQREEFKQLGVQMNWDKPYLTMDHSYEANILRAFGKFVKDGYVAKKLKTVPWCASCETVLSNAEIEHQDRKDPSIYVQFPFDQSESLSLFPEAEGREVSLLIWTTTPWTLPLNRAVVLKPKAEYQLVEINEKLVVIGKELVPKVCAAIGVEPSIIATVSAESLIGKKVSHPFVADLYVPVIGDGFVSLEDGTACVHSAPGCGPEDYEIGVKNKLEIYSPITVDGRYTSEIMPEELTGMPVSEGQIWVIRKLAALDKILFKTSLRHAYPHCWRCHKGLIFRATAQWFCDLSQNDLRQRALDSIDQMKMLPETGKNRLKAAVEGRLEWCLSRQRAWGVPIPGLICSSCDHVSISADFIEIVSKGIEKEGVEYWDTVTLSSIVPSDFSCLSCGESEFKKEKDILDVWFDSGVSHYAVLFGNNDVSFPAQLYLEGKDQHRGWFQSSLLTSLVLEGDACTSSILTHGFVVDEKNKKMSKSVGNVVSPKEIIDQIGTDGLRLWVASNDYDSDPVASQALFKNVAEVYRKVRNTCRFLLSNLYDFDIEKDAVSIDKMLLIDQLALIKLDEFNNQMRRAYDERKSTAAFHALADYCVKELSSFYLDIIKDRLYVEKSDGLLRRSAQTVCYHILDTMTKVMAPILSFTSELISDEYQDNKQDSIHLQDFAKTDHFVSMILERMQSFDAYLATHAGFTSLCEEQYLAIWGHVLTLRSHVLKQLEELRGQGDIRHSLDASVLLHIDKNYEGYGSLTILFDLVKSSEQSLAQFLQEFFIVSQVIIHDEVLSDMKEVDSGLFIQVLKSAGVKCTRCWQWTTDISDDQLCSRCTVVLS